MKKAYLYIIFSTILFSSMEIALKLTINQFNPVQLTFLRFFIGAIMLLPLSIKNIKAKNLSLNINDFVFFMLEGFICVVISMSFYQLSLIYNKASIVAILFSCNPIFVIFFAYFILKEKINKKTISSLILSILGMICIMNPFYQSNSVIGIVFVLLSAITFAFYGVSGKKRSSRYGSIISSCFCFLMGSTEMFILILISKIKPVSTWLTSIGLRKFANVPILQGVNLNSLPSLIYIGLFVTGLGYTFYFLAMEKASAATASLIFYIKPALAPILAFIILHESILPNTFAGIILIIAGSSITFISNKQASEVPLCKDN